MIFVPSLNPFQMTLKEWQKESPHNEQLKGDMSGEIKVKRFLQTCGRLQGNGTGRIKAARQRKLWPGEKWSSLSTRRN